MKKVFKKSISIVLILFLIFVFLGCTKGRKDKFVKLDEYGYPQILEKEVEYIQDENKQVKNIILILGDGMGFNHIEVTKMLLEEGRSLDLDLLEYKGEIMTSCLDNYVTDSAASATAYATGVKTLYERAGKDKDGNNLKTILDYAKEAGKKTGVITDKPLKDGTPLAFTAHLENRYRNTYGIAKEQILSGVDIMMGTGYSDFKDYEDLLIEEGYTLVRDKEQMISLDSDKFIGAFSDGSMLMTASIYPSIAEMAYKALEQFSKNEEGFFLLVESGQIDNYCGKGDIESMTDKVVALDQVLRVSMNFAKENPETLIIVLADHETGGLVIGEGEPSSDWFTEPEKYHTPVNVPLFAYGMNSSAFEGKVLDNTEVFEYMMKLLGLEK